MKCPFCNWATSWLCWIGDDEGGPWDGTMIDWPGCLVGRPTDRETQEFYLCMVCFGIVS